MDQVLDNHDNLDNSEPHQDCYQILASLPQQVVCHFCHQCQKCKYLAREISQQSFCPICSTCVTNFCNTRHCDSYHPNNKHGSTGRPDPSRCTNESIGLVCQDWSHFRFCSLKTAKS